MIRQFEFKKSDIPGVIEIQAFCAEDVRGCLTKDYSKEVFAGQGIEHELKEVFYTTSHRGVVRALHFQREKQQAKLVRCIYGKIFDVAVDLRVDSPTFKQWRSFELSGENNREVLIPAGCAHGYLVLEESIVSYKCAERFYEEYDDGIAWDDPDLAVEWPLELVGEKIILADKDKGLQSFAQFMEAYGGFQV